MDEDTETPMNWLWERLREQLGPDTARDLHQEYNGRLRRYQKKLESARDQEQIQRMRHYKEELAVETNLSRQIFLRDQIDSIQRALKRHGAWPETTGEEIPPDATSETREG